MDERLTNIEAQKQAQLNKNDQLYSGLLTDAQNLYNQQQNYANQYQQTQNEILDKQLAYNTGLIEQQKEIARENARTEQNKAKNDYFSYINPYGLQAESLASKGLLNSGVSETAKLGGFNTYQNRLANANKVMQDAITQYDNDINAARLNNDVSKAQNALEKLKMQLQYSENYYNKKGELQQTQFDTGRNIDADYYNRYQTEYKNIQDEKAQQEAIRQWEAQMAYQRERDRIADEQWAKEYALSKSKAAASRSSSGSGGYTLTGGGSQLTNNNTANTINGSNYTVSGDANGKRVVTFNDGYVSVVEKPNPDGWSLTDLTQTVISDGNAQNAEVYLSPNGELLFWNPKSNSWKKFEK